MRKSTALGLCKQQAVEAKADVAQVSFVTLFEFDDRASRILYFHQGLANFPPVGVALSEVYPPVSIPLTLEVFDMQFDDALAQRANPILR